MIGTADRLPERRLTSLGAGRRPLHRPPNGKEAIRTTPEILDELLSYRRADGALVFVAYRGDW